MTDSSLTSKFKYLLNEDEKVHLLSLTIPTIFTSSLLSPISRLKIILQVMPCISIHDAEKETKPYRLLKSKDFAYF
jgi:hypothetical protein